MRWHFFMVAKYDAYGDDDNRNADEKYVCEQDGVDADADKGYDND